MAGRLRWRAPLGAALVALVVLPLSVLAGATLAPSPAPAPADTSGALPESYPWVRLAERLTSAVVNVRVVGEARGGRERGDEGMPELFRRFLPPELRERGPRTVRGLGSGFIIDPSGLIVTNHHVVNEAKAIEVSLSDGRKLEAKLVGSDPETDLALLRVEASDLPTVPLGRSSALRVGEPIMAIGNPFGLDHTVTVGIISGTGRVIGAGRYDDFLQTDAAINPGNSGGPLINTRGEAVGIATAIASRSGGFQGIGFAIPMDLARPIVEQLRTVGHVTRGWLGVSIQPLTPELAKSFGLEQADGALVASVVDGSPAAQAGLKAGDVVLRYGGRTVSGARDLSAQVASTAIGRAVQLEVWRDGARHRLDVTIGNLADARRAESSSSEPQVAGRLGLALEELTPELARRLGVKQTSGVVVTQVQPESAAAQAGIAPGDVIREVNRVRVQGLDDVQKGMARQAREASHVLLRVERDGASRYVTVEIG